MLGNAGMREECGWDKGWQAALIRRRERGMAVGSEPGSAQGHHHPIRFQRGALPVTSFVPPRFTVDVKPERARVIVVLSGELDVASADALRAAVADIRDSGCEDIVVDPRELCFIDSAGLAVLMAADRRAHQEGWRFSVLEGCSPLDRLLAITGLSSELALA
jgi:anti-sigma B factor antagonist